MDYFIITLRLLHIVFGVFWGGTALFVVLVLQPRLAKLGPNFQGPVLNTIMPLVGKLMTLSALTIIVTGLSLTFLVWGSFNMLFTTGSGLVLVLGFLTTLSATIVGTFIIGPTGEKIGALSASFAGRAPNSEELGHIGLLAGRLTIFTRINFVLVCISILSMVFFRYV